MKLILIRHAKSSWDDPTVTDHDRPLNPRGRKSATAIGTWLAQNDHRPDVVLCSSSTRTQETFALMRATLATPRLEIHKDLYHATPDVMLRYLRAQTAHTVALIAHNPGIGDLAQSLALSAPNHPRFPDYPTAATTVFDVADWSALAPNTAETLAFTTPRDLLG